MSKPVVFKFDCGDVVTDRVTGFKGTITGRCEYMTGCRQYSLVPKIEKKDGSKFPDGVWMDEDRLVMVKAISPPEPVNRGGPSHCEPPIG